MPQQTKLLEKLTEAFYSCMSAERPTTHKELAVFFDELNKSLTLLEDIPF